jgi:hypothetical protein
MTLSNIITRTDLARSTRQAIERARRGQTIIVESYGEEQVAIVDAIDYRLLRAVASYQPEPNAPFQNEDADPRGLSAEEVEAAVANGGGDIQVAWDHVISAYLNVEISLGRAAELLGLDRFDLTERLNRLGLPLRLGPATIAEARAEYETLKQVTQR